MDDAPIKPDSEIPDLDLTYIQRLRIWETNYGRESDWILELSGEPIALLTEPRWDDMFWYEYRMTPLTQDADLLSQLQTEDFWNEMDGFVWRSREFGIVAPHAFTAGGFKLANTGRVLMRALCIQIEPPRSWDQFILWLCKISQERENRH